MANYRLSAKAHEDVRAIADYTIKTFGVEQARRYRHGLEQALQMLAERPLRGHSAEELAPELRRWRYQSHVIFYLPEAEGIRVVRVLHQRMDFGSALVD